MWRLHSGPGHPAPGTIDIDVVFATRTEDVLVVDFVVAADVPAPFGEFLRAGQPFGLPFRVPAGNSTGSAHRQLCRWSSSGEPVTAHSGVDEDGRQRLVLAQGRSQVVLEFLT